MRFMGRALIGLGVVLFVLGGSLRVTGWRGQLEAPDGRKPEAASVASVKSKPDTRMRLLFPAQQRELFVYEGTSRRSLLLGPAHVSWSGDPGGAGNCIIAGHRD